MSDTNYYIRIKKDYASAVLEDLLKADAIEMVEDTMPEWQQQEALKRLQRMKDHPESAIPHTEFVRLLESDDE